MDDDNIEKPMIVDPEREVKQGVPFDAMCLLTNEELIAYTDELGKRSMNADGDGHDMDSEAWKQYVCCRELQRMRITLGVFGAFWNEARMSSQPVLEAAQEEMRKLGLL